MKRLPKPIYLWCHGPPSVGRHLYAVLGISILTKMSLRDEAKICPKITMKNGGVVLEYALPAVKPKIFHRRPSPVLDDKQLRELPTLLRWNHSGLLYVACYNDCFFIFPNARETEGWLDPFFPGSPQLSNDDRPLRSSSAIRHDLE